MKLGQNINKHRKRLQLSQNELADKLGVTRQAISKWETDTAFPDITNLISLANLFEVSVDTLLVINQSPTKSAFSDYIGWKCDIITKSLINEVQRNVIILGVIGSFIIIKKQKKYKALGSSFVHSIIMKEKIDISNINLNFEKVQLNDIINKCNVYSNPNGKYGGSTYLFASLIDCNETLTKIKSGKYDIDIPTDSISLISSLQNIATDQESSNEKVTN